jgi:hypothetical protein
MKPTDPLLLDQWILSNMVLGSDLSGAVRLPNLSARCRDPGSAHDHGDAWLGTEDPDSLPQESEPREYARPEPALVPSSSRSVRAEPRSQPTRYRRAPWRHLTLPGQQAHHRWPGVSFPSGPSSWPRPWANRCSVGTGRRSPLLLGSLAPLLGPALGHRVGSATIEQVRLQLLPEVLGRSVRGVSTRRRTRRRLPEPPHARRFGFQRGVMVASRSQLGLPA